VDRLADTPDVHRDGLQLPDWREQTEDLINEYQSLDVPRSSGPAVERDATTRDYLVIRISDNGIGIPEEDLITVAEPFRQASNSPDLGIKGKGLGLALAHKTISRFGGYLCCKSTEGSGAKFSVFLPLSSD
jgi:signal transduction histidine kinase